MGETGDTALTGGVRTKDVGNFLQGGDAGDSIAWVGDVGPFEVNGKEVRGHTHGVPATDHKEEREATMIRNMGDSGGGRRTRGSREPSWGGSS